MRHKMEQPIKVLVVDDSAVMRKLISDILERSPDIEIVGTARDGTDALTKARSLRPNVITMDIEMPKMDGLTALQHIMVENPIPVIMVSAMDKRQADITIKALDLGAVDFIPKTSGTLSLDMDKMGDTLISKVKIAARIKPRKKKEIKVAPVSFPKFRIKKYGRVVAIGASTGGPKAIPEVLCRLPSNLPAGILIVQHMPEGFTRSFAERLNWYTSLEVREAEEGDEIEPGTVLIAPGNLHMEVKKNRVHLTDGPHVNNVRPSVDVLMKSTARIYGPGCIGVLLTGMGADGAQGMKEIKNCGGRTIAQNEKTSIVYGMPKAAVELRVVDRVVPLQNIARDIIYALEDDR
jgi:two-component system chemotaxis response regulator CheB